MNEKAYTLAKLKNKEQALETIKRLIELEPNAYWYDTYGEILLKFNDFNEAIKQFENALKINSNAELIYETYIKLGKSHKNLGQYEVALENLEKGKKIAEQRRDQHWIKQADKYILDIKSNYEKR